MFLFPLLALVWLPLCLSLKIFIPGKVVQGEDVPVQLTYEPGVDVLHNSFFLKKYGLDENKLLKPLFPVEDFVGNTTVYISFFRAMRYVVIAVNDPDNQNLQLTNALATSNPIVAERKKCHGGDDGKDNKKCWPWKDDKDDDDDDDDDEDEDEDESGSLSETPATSSGSSKKTLLIVGSVLGSVAIVVIIALLVYLLYRLRGRSFSPHRMVRDSSSPDSYQQYITSKYPSTLHTVRTPSMVSADPYGYLKRVSPPPTYPSIHHNYPTINVEAPSTRTPSSSAFTIATFNPTPFTDRQMDIHHRLYEMQQEILHLEKKVIGGDGDAVENVDNDVSIMHLKTSIGILRDYLDSDWALHKEDVMPKDLQRCMEES